LQTLALPLGNDAEHGRVYTTDDPVSTASCREFRGIPLIDGRFATAAANVLAASGNPLRIILPKQGQQFG
jgi:hypothetical protein